MGNNQESGSRVLYSCMPIFSHENTEIFIISDNKTFVKTEQPIGNDKTHDIKNAQQKNIETQNSNLYKKLLSIF
jgi:hypothetical protein